MIKARYKEIKSKTTDTKTIMSIKVIEKSIESLSKKQKEHFLNYKNFWKTKKCKGKVNKKI